MQKLNYNTMTTSALIVLLAQGYDAIGQVVDTLRARKELKGKPAADVRAVVLPILATHYGCPTNEDGTSLVKAGTDAKLYARTTKRIQRVVKDIVGESANNHESQPTKVRVKADERAAALALLEACGGDLKRATAILKVVA